MAQTSWEDVTPSNHTPQSKTECANGSDAAQGRIPATSKGSGALGAVVVKPTPNAELNLQNQLISQYLISDDTV
jgi:hypothetical protein